jgi:porin
MKINVKTFVLATAFFTSSWPACFDVRGQDPAPSPSPASTAQKAKTDADAVANAEAKKVSDEELQEVSGEWGGARSRWKEKGIEMEFRLVLFGQGTATGGIRRDAEFNGVFKSKFKFDLGKAVGWKFWSAEIGTETRFGGPSLGGIGTINPVNTAVIIPGPTGTNFAIGALNVTRLFPIDLKKGNLIAVSVGRFNLVDLADEDFFGGGGTTRFFNIAQIGPLTVLRQIPLITNGATFAYVHHGEPRFTFAFIDPNDHSLTTGLPDMFADGVTLSPTYLHPTKYWGKSGEHSVGFAITTKEYTPFDNIRQIIIPGPPINPIGPEGGSWSVNYTFRQAIVERAPRDSWGFFAQISFADQATSPITNFISTGIGGNGLFKSRNQDEFGIAYAYTGLSDVLKDNIELLPIGGRPRAEHQVELFYNYHMKPWLRLTGDIQFIRPTRVAADFAVVPGVRMEIIF